MHLKDQTLELGTCEKRKQCTFLLELKPAELSVIPKISLHSVTCSVCGISDTCCAIAYAHHNFRVQAELHSNACDKYRCVKALQAVKHIQMFVEPFNTWYNDMDM